MIFGGLVDNVAGGTHPVEEGDTINLLKDKASVRCHATPCHTKGHILFECEAKS